MTRDPSEDAIDGAFAALEDDERRIDEVLAQSPDALDAELGPERVARAKARAAEAQRRFEAELATIAAEDEAEDEAAAGPVSGPVPGRAEADGAPHVARAIDPPAESVNKPLPVRRVAVVWLLAAAFVALALGGGVALGLFDRKVVPEPVPNEVVPPEPGPVRAPPDNRMAAESLRAEARKACDAKDWSRCAWKLDQARALDPAGDKSPEVTAMRLAIARGQPAPPPRDDEKQAPKGR